MSTLLITGCAGFIGYHVAHRLLTRGADVIGVDSLTPYYDPALKHARLANLATSDRFRFRQLDICDGEPLSRLVKECRPAALIHLAAQAGVRYSIENAAAYGSANLVGWLNVLEASRHAAVPHVVFASSSSVYGATDVTPFCTSQRADHPISLYAATKRAGELMAHSYAHLYDLPITVLRFFTVYGPFGRPDMALFTFTRAILDGQPLLLFNRGQMSRDFTYVDDIAECVVRVAARPPTPNGEWNAHQPDPATSTAPYRVFNVGNGKPVPLRRLVELLEENLGKSAIIQDYPMQPGDVPATWADTGNLLSYVAFRPQVSIEEGVRRFVEWYRSHYQLTDCAPPVSARTPRAHATVQRPSDAEWERQSA